MVIQTPRLCHDVAFLPPQKDQPNAIACAPILAEDEVEDYEADLQALQNAEKAAAKSWQEADLEGAAPALDADDDLPATQAIVGDILVGGHILVPPGKTLAKGAIVGGGKETYIDTVASSDGKTLSREDMEKLGLGDAKAVEKLRKELEKIAQGQEWKLDVIDTPRGREYRGIIGKDDEEEEGGEKDRKGEGKEEEEDQAQEGSQEEYYKEEL